MLHTGGIGLHRSADLLGQSLEIEIVPGFDNLSIFDSDYGDPGEFNGPVCCRNAQHVALMCARNDAPGSDFVSLGNGIRNLDMNIGERLCELEEERFEPRWSAKFLAMLIKQPVRDGIVGKKAIDCVDLGFVPHLLEPLVRKSFAFHWINAAG